MSDQARDHVAGDYIDEEMALDEMETDGVDWVFRPTNPVQPGVRNRYRRLRLEMQILASKAHEDLGDIHRNRNWMIKHERAEGYMRKLLDAEMRVYSMATSTISVDDNTPEEPSFHKLGVTADFKDAIVSDFYALQVKHDEPKTSYYLSALEAIARRRQADLLLTLYQTQKSLGAFTRQDLSDAYRIFTDNPGIDRSRTFQSYEDDETLINIAASMMLDDIPRKVQIRRALEIIGKDRDSQEIRKYLNAPERDFDFDAALRYLGAEENTDDDFLITLFDIKQEENPQLSRSALETIADERKNVRLKRFLETGDRSTVPSVTFNMPDETDVEMLDPDLAYSRLGVDDRSTDDDMLVMLYEIRVADDPGDTEALKKALELLGDVRNSQVIKNFICTGSKETTLYVPPEATNDRPVGLENIGNTCYLNSLLQYYFTIRPLRHAVLEPQGLIEEEISGAVLTKKQVGGRTVTREEVERALRFMKELKRLFRTLISCQEASVKPSRAVCFLALVSQKDEKDQCPILDATTMKRGEQLPGADMTLQSTKANQMVKFIDRSNKLLLTEDASAEGLQHGQFDHPEPFAPSPKRKVSADWVDVAPPTKQRDSSPNLMDLDNEEPKSPGRDTHQYVLDKPLGVLSSFADSSYVSESPVINEIDQKRVRTTSTDVSPSRSDQASSSDDGVSLENKVPETAWDPVLVDAPALPSRKTDRRRQSSLQWSDTNDWGRQQDVAECIDNVLFQMEASLKPVKHDSEGEQVDLVKDLFYGTTKQTIELEDHEPKIERFSNTIVTLERDGQDIYEALDGVFDAREVELGGAQVKLNLTIVQAPPILQLQIQRVNFDLKTMSAVKSNVYLALDQSIYLDRYIETQSLEMLEKREEHWQWKKDLLSEHARREELNNLITASQMVGPRYSDHNWSATENEVSSDDEVEAIHLEHAAPVLTQEEVLRRGSVREIVTELSIEDDKLSLDELEQQLRSCEAKERDLSWKLGHLFDENIAHEYRLHSVFIHRGEASHGHYWVYIYDFTMGRWMKYNDEEVSVVPKEEVFKDRVGSNENPYMLSYVKADKLELVSSLERDMGRQWEDESLI